MKPSEVDAAKGHRVRVTDGIEPYEGVLSDAQRDYVETGAWGGKAIRNPIGWDLVIDGRRVNVPDSAELEVLD